VDVVKVVLFLVVAGLGGFDGESNAAGELEGLFYLLEVRPLNPEATLTLV
jgi:hypothetical protein